MVTDNDVKCFNCRVGVIANANELGGIELASFFSCVYAWRV